MYGRDYYESANYRDYLERGDRYRRTAHEVVGLLGSLGLVERDSRILDYGSAVGLFLDGLREAGYSTAVGVDISEWARAEARRRGFRVYASAADVGAVDVLVALDVFEHMDDDAITAAIRDCAPRAFVARIPTSTDGATFHLAVSRADPTHVNCKTKQGWENFFWALGYTTMRLNLYSVYDTPGVTCLLGVRGSRP